jgi:hypothetical protein
VDQLSTEWTSCAVYPQGWPEAVEHVAYYAMVDAPRRDAYPADADARDRAGHSPGQAFERQAQVGLLRCIFGNPFRPGAVDDAWLAWNDNAVRRMAQAIYNERGFDRLPILGGALEDAGCTDRDILDHCRGPGPHVRGCWAVDLLLGKG